MADLTLLALRYRGPQEVLFAAFGECGCRVRRLRTVEGRIEFQLPYGQLRALRRAVRGRGRLEIVGHGGAGLVLRALRQRPWRAIVPALALFCYLAAASRVWTIEIVGPSDLPRARILAVLAEQGLRPFAARARVHPYRLGVRLTEEVPHLIFAAVRLDGVRAEVFAAPELRPPQARSPEVQGAITAQLRGYVTRVVVLRGTPLVRAGETVLPGEPLVLPRDGYAAAEVYARIWRDYTLRVPAETVRRIPTGRRAVRWYIDLGHGRKWALQGRKSPFRESRVLVRRWRIPLGTVEVGRLTFVELRQVVLRPQQGYLEVRAADSALGQLQQELPGATPRAIRAEADLAGGVWTVRVQVEAECDIAHQAEGAARKLERT